MYRIFAIFVSVATLLAGSHPVQATQEPSAPRFTLTALRAHIDFLADDLLEGRATGTRGYDIAASYVASVFAGLDLEPAGDDDTWYQSLDLIEGRLLDGSAALTLHGPTGDRRLALERDYMIGGSYVDPINRIEGPVTFVGFGVSAPELGHDDYAGLDVSGHIVAMFSGAPASFHHNQRAFYSSGRNKSREAAARGAVGILSFNTPEQLTRSPWAHTVDAYAFPGMRWVDGDQVQGLFPPIQAGASLSPSGLEALLWGSGSSLEDLYAELDAGAARPRRLAVAATLERSSSQTRQQSANVAGILRGSDPRLADEYVVITAHLDHIGVGPVKDGDSIYNGAYDNATGIAVMLEVARALAESEPGPARSVLFLAVTGEEKGLLGSDYFAEYPTVPIDAIAANVNLDMPIFTYPFADITAFGAEHSSLEPLAKDAARGASLMLGPDPMPEEVIFVRSDQYSFVKRGVPSVFLVPGFTSRDPAIDGREQFMRFLTTHYHQPTDELNLPFDEESALRFTLMNYLFVRAIADGPQRPRWNAGDFFGDRFARPDVAGVSAPK